MYVDIKKGDMLKYFLKKVSNFSYKNFEMYLWVLDYKYLVI